jgi:hypothetical protein
MTRRMIVLFLAVSAASAFLLWPAGGGAASRTQTLRFYDQPVSIKLTRADGTVVARPPYPEARPGDTLDVSSLEYAGNHARHAKRWTASAHLRCVFRSGPPTCESHVAIGGSLLVFTGNPGTLTHGTGIYLGATGRVISNTEVPGTDDGSDIVAKIRLRS